MSVRTRKPVKRTLPFGWTAMASGTLSSGLGLTDVTSKAGSRGGDESWAAATTPARMTSIRVARHRTGMATIIVETRIAAPIELCFDLARDVEVHVATSVSTGERVVGRKSSGRLALGDIVTF